MGQRILSISDLHGTERWIEWILENASKYDAILFPGDLVDGMYGKEEAEFEKILEMFRLLSQKNIPCLLCSGNHDAGLNNVLLNHQDEIPGIILDGEHLELDGLKMQSLPYMEPLPEEGGGNHIWLFHEPPQESSISMDDMENSFGSIELSNRCEFVPDSLPPVVIGGHQHYAEEWHCIEGRTLFLNSGQDLRASAPNHIVIQWQPNILTFTHHPSKESVRRSLS